MSSHNTKKIAFVMAGCGAKDGTEITEAVSLLIALSQSHMDVHMFAPDRPVHHVVNHLSSQEEPSASRNILIESARIARGHIAPLTKLEPAKYDALVFSGGFGVAKNLCNFAFAGKDAKLQSDVQSVLFSFLENRKPIGALCIAPVLLALAAREKNLQNAQITLGAANSSEAQIVQSWGVAHIPKTVREACIDPTHKFVSAPAYMYPEATPADIFASASALVQSLNTLL